MVSHLSLNISRKWWGLIMHTLAARPGVVGQRRPGNRFTHPLAQSQSQSHGYQENGGY